jgi:hypothetical protein
LHSSHLCNQITSKRVSNLLISDSISLLDNFNFLSLDFGGGGGGATFDAAFLGVGAGNGGGF